MACLARGIEAPIWGWRPAGSFYLQPNAFVRTAGRPIGLGNANVEFRPVWVRRQAAERLSNLRRRSEFIITDTLEKAMAPAASIGFILPRQARGIISTL